MTTVISAPGKVLIAGGYLVLDPDYQGLVVSTDARFYTIIRKSPELSKKVVVRSPQFEDGWWEYDLHVEDDRILAIQSSEGESNKFVETALKTCFTLIQQIIGPNNIKSIIASNLEITIVGSNDFYSQREQLRTRSLPLTMASLHSLPPFCATHTKLKEVHKTGLGSSAAMITSLVAALLVHTGATTLLNIEGRRLIHNTAQFVHCLAQGKIGSGFDVSAAVWGSHRYRRFDPNVIDPVMHDAVAGSTLLQVLRTEWDNEVTQFKLPPRLRLMLADIDAGSHTPTLVRKVLAWRKENKDEADHLWGKLRELNGVVEDNLKELGRIALEEGEIYEKGIQECAKFEATKWPNLSAYSTNGTVKLLADTAATYEKARALIRKMSELSNVPIEPPEQTRLLDRCMLVPGCIMSGVPGAGGYDAIFCIAISDKAKQAIELVWQEWKEMSVGPLLAQEDFVGVHEEVLDNVIGLKEVL